MASEVYTFTGIVAVSIDIEADSEEQAYFRLGHVMANASVDVEGDVRPHVLTSSVMTTEEYGLPVVTEVTFPDDDDDAADDFEEVDQ